MAKVAWISRHPPLPVQISELKRKLGEDVEVIQISRTFASADEVLREVKALGATHAVVVLPLSMVAHLVNDKSITWLFAKMEAIAQVKSIEEAKRIVDEKPEARTMTTYADGTVRVFEFKEFQRIVKVELITEPW
ncbi:MAG: hypothetical protein ACTSXC_08190 [Candidatus Freyarchaeota archaeon]